MVDATDATVQMGNPFLANIVIIGACSALGALPLGRTVFEDVIRETFSPDRVEVNQRAFDCGISKISVARAENRRAIGPDTCFALRGNGRSPEIAAIHKRKKGKYTDGSL